MSVFNNFYLIFFFECSHFFLEGGNILCNSFAYKLLFSYIFLLVKRVSKSLGMFFLVKTVALHRKILGPFFLLINPL